jgi:hypothetical protein
MDTSLGALRARLFNFRAWDSTGPTLDGRIVQAMNTALERISGDVPEAVVPDDEHVVLQKDVVGEDADVAARVSPTADTKVMQFVNTSGLPLVPSSPWLPDVTGTFDGIMHIEVVDANGQIHRRQCREFWTVNDPLGVPTNYYVSLDRPWGIGGTAMKFRLHQPEFFVTDDVTRVLEPARLWDETRQQVWAIDTGGAYRQDMVDYRGQDKGQPFRLWRNRHFQVPAPTTAPTAAPTNPNTGAPWAGPEWEGTFQFCFTYVWGRRDLEWQRAPVGIRDPQWESAPSPLSAVYTQTGAAAGRAIAITATNIDAMMDFGDISTLRYSRSGMRIRIYVARTGVQTTTPYGTGFNRVETNGKFYLLDEIEPTNGTFTWNGSAIPDYQRELKHSTGYYAYQVFPHQDQRYELDLRVQRLPKKLKDDQDTPPIQRDAVPSFIELCLYYMCLLDGVDQTGANIHLSRYNELCRHFRKRYANPGGAVDPMPITGFTARFRFGRFRDTT